MANQVLARREGKLFCEKRVMVKVGIPPSIKNLRNLKKKNWPERDLFSEQRNPDQKRPEIETIVSSKGFS